MLILEHFEDDLGQWDRTVSDLTASVYFGSEWTARVAAGFGASPLCVSACERGIPVAVCPGIVIRRGPFRVFYSSIPYGGVAGTEDGIGFLLSELPALLRDRGVHRIRIQPLPGREVSHAGYAALPVLIPLLNIRGLSCDSLLDSFGSRQRRDIRKATRDGVTVRRASGLNDIREFFRLYRLSQARNRAFARYPLGYFENTFSKWGASGHLSVYMAGFENRTIAGMMTLRSESTVHYLHGGLDYEFRQYCANDLLVFTALSEAIDAGAVQFDFGGTDPADSALLRFKTKWGSEVSNVPVLGMDLDRARCACMDALLKLLIFPPLAFLYNALRDLGRRDEHE